MSSSCLLGTYSGGYVVLVFSGAHIKLAMSSSCLLGAYSVGYVVLVLAGGTYSFGYVVLVFAGGIFSWLCRPCVCWGTYSVGCVVLVTIRPDDSGAALNCIKLAMSSSCLLGAYSVGYVVLVFAGGIFRWLCRPIPTNRSIFTLYLLSSINFRPLEVVSLPNGIFSWIPSVFVFMNVIVNCV